MLSVHKIKIIQSLDKKKFRQKYNLFLVEGNKTIRELENSRFEIKEIYTTDPDFRLNFATEVFQISPADLKKISFLQHPKDSVAICALPAEAEQMDSDLNLVLDGIQDPGNLGTLIRLCDWFGIPQIVCSRDSVDCFNPKVIQASMGSFVRVNVVYADLEEFMNDSEKVNLGADMDGENIYKFNFPEKFNLILGNEGNGIRPSVENLLTNKICIPRFGKNQSTESLNVSMAAGIIFGQIYSKK